MSRDDNAYKRVIEEEYLYGYKPDFKVAVESQNDIYDLMDAFDGAEVIGIKSDGSVIRGESSNLGNIIREVERSYDYSTGWGSASIIFITGSKVEVYDLSDVTGEVILIVRGYSIQYD